MTTNSYKNIEKLEADLWEAADNLRANSKLTSSDYFMPVLGVTFRRHASYVSSSALSFGSIGAFRPSSRATILSPWYRPFSIKTLLAS